ncbi:MAG: Cys-tRNA(Pro) deacylase [Oscillospiraceae bacterium]|nr:Cys-tRNA(Pro) deacylase [Oscillospiraceae bacterium]
MAKNKKIITNAMRILDKAKIHYDAVEYKAEEVGEHFGSAIAELTGIPNEKCFKTLVARGDKTGVIVMCIPVDDEVDLKKLAKISGNKRAEMIHVKELAELTGYIRGGVSPIGMKKKYPTYVNITAKSFDTIAVSAGICGCSLMIAPDDIQRITGCVFEDLTKSV